MDDNCEDIKSNAKTHVALSVPPEIAADIIEAMAGVRAELSQDILDDAEPGDDMQIKGEGLAIFGHREAEKWKIDLYFLEETNFAFQQQ